MFQIHQPHGVAARRQSAVGLPRSLSQWAALAALLRRTAPVVLSALIASCGASGTDTPAEPGDSTPPTVTSVSPANNAANVGLTTSVSATFSEPITGASASNASFTIATEQGAAIAGSVTVSGNTVTFEPMTSFPGRTRLVATLAASVRDAAGNALASSFTWSFTTGAEPDVTAPTVTGTSPLSGALAVALNSAVSVTFSEAMTPSTITPASVTVAASGGAPVAGTVSMIGTTVTFTPTADFSPGTLYSVTVTTAAKDAAGNPLASNFVSTFTTGATPDTTAPTVTATTPATNATGVSRSTAVAATFSEPMSDASITTTSFTLAPTAGGGAVAGTVSVAGSVATLTPAASLAGSTQYTATLTTAVRDVAGNALAATYSWAFTTAAAPDLTPPTVIATTPANGATSVALNATPAVTFSEPMTNSTLNTSTFTLVTTIGSVAVAGTVSVSGNTATFTPSASLAGSTQYTATVTTGARDAAGNALAANASWSFTTAASGGAAPGLGAHAMAFRGYLDQSKPVVATVPLVTRATGSTILACVARGFVTDHVPPTDNKGNTYTQIGVAHVYSKWTSSGTACYVATNAAGGSGHVVTAPNGVAEPRDEVTISVVEIVNASRVQDFKWNEDLISPLVSQNVTTTGPATLIALWWGDGDVSTVHTATPNNSFGVIHSLLDLGALIQVSTATRNVTAAGTYNVTWTSGEGAQLWIFAVQP